MKHTLILTLAVAFGLTFFNQALSAQNQSQNEKPKSIEEIATERADALGVKLRLEYWQVFYVDSILQTNLKGLEEDFKRLKESHVSMDDIYIDIQDKWMEKTDQAFKKIFTEEQWKRYLASGARRTIKEREKRAREKQESSLEILKDGKE